MFENCYQVRCDCFVESELICTLPRGTLVGRLLDVRNNRAKISLPNPSYDNQESSSGASSSVDLVEGWVNLVTAKGAVALAPLKHHHKWQRWGRSRLHISTCGHGVHSVINKNTCTHLCVFAL